MNRKAIWGDMIRKSWSPTQWFERDEAKDDQLLTENRIMWVYRRLEGDVIGSKLYEVGFFDPSGQWIKEDEYPDRASAAARVHYLMGGSE